MRGLNWIKNQVHTETDMLAGRGLTETHRRSWSSIVGVRPDYRNALLYGTNTYKLHALQDSAQNCSAYIVRYGTKLNKLVFSK